MNPYHMTDSEIALTLSQSLKKWRLDPQSLGLTQQQLADKSGISLTSLKRFEKTGHITLHNFIAILRGLDLLESIEHLLPTDYSNPGPLAILQKERHTPPPTPASSSLKKG